MRNVFTMSLFTLTFLVSLSAGAEESAMKPGNKSTTSNDDQALQAGVNALSDKDARQAMVNKDKAAKEADDNMKMVMGNEANTEEAYQISAELLPWIKQQAGGDDEKMALLLETYKTDPGKLLAQMPEAQRNKIRKLASQIPQK